mmetsp:Transcript_13899/g.45366  ORF Transcript_13899/g.45366 Transcript_13899/m.45366 type:complete len:250 (-) Transcript_13899:2938-3687(-)
MPLPLTASIDRAGDDDAAPGLPMAATSGVPSPSTRHSPTTYCWPVINPFVPSIGSRIHTLFFLPSLSSSSWTPRSTAARNDSIASVGSFSQQHLVATSRAAAARSASARRSAASSSPMKRSSGNAARSRSLKKPWSPKSSAVTGVSSALTDATPLMASVDSTCVPMLASATAMDACTSRHKSTAVLTNDAATFASPAYSPAHSSKEDDLRRGALLPTKVLLPTKGDARRNTVVKKMKQRSILLTKLHGT